MAQQRQVFFSGQVQGVGFRAATAQLAAKTAVTGTVQNLPDGRVELVAEGEPAEIDYLLQLVRDRFGPKIEHEEATEQPTTTTQLTGTTRLTGFRVL